jgi:predicted nucleotidyltransferase
MELSPPDIDMLNEFFGKESLKRITIRGSFAKGMLSLSRDVDMLFELDYPAALGPVLASMKFALRGILRLHIDIETVSGVRRCISVFLNERRTLIFEE